MASAAREHARGIRTGTDGTQQLDMLHGDLLSVDEQDQQLATPPRHARSWNLEQIGFHDLGGYGQNSDVWALGKYVYVGIWRHGLYCPVLTQDPGTGVKVIDVSDPAAPVLINKLPVPRFTRINDVKAAHIETAFFQGDLLLVSNEDCRYLGARGVEIWDVTDPPNATLLASLGPRRVLPGESDEWGDGVHNLYLYQKGGRAFALLATLESEIFQIEAGVPPVGDLKIVELTNPREPVLIATWGIKPDLGEPVGRISNDGTVTGDDCRPVCRFGSASIQLHDVWTNREGTVAYLSYWDAGLILLDISDPSQPRFLGRANYLEDSGNTHSAVPAQGGNLVIVGDEAFGMFEGNPRGFMRVFDTTDPRAPVEVGGFQTEHTTGPKPDDGDYSIHNIFVRGATVYASWYSDGVRLVDISTPAAPREVASFIPPDVPDPVGVLPTKAEVWGIYVQNDLIFASDMNAGLYILKRRRLHFNPESEVDRIWLDGDTSLVTAILGSAELDVTRIDAAHLVAGPEGAPPIAGSAESRYPRVEDVNGDGFDDLLVQFDLAATGIAPGDSEVCVSGETIDGVSVAACDSVEVLVGKRGALRSSTR